MIVGAPDLFWSSLHRDNFRIVYRPTWYDARRQLCPGFIQFCRLCFRRGDLWMIVDEAHQFCSPHSIPAELLTVARLGRHREVSLLYVTQSFTAVERTLTRNTNCFCFFRIFDDLELEGIRRRCGSQEIADQVRSLQKLDLDHNLPAEVLVWHDTGQVSKFFLRSDQVPEVRTSSLEARGEVSSKESLDLESDIE